MQSAVIVLRYELAVLYPSDAPLISVLNYCFVTIGVEFRITNFIILLLNRLYR